jgi:phosphatidyl-myo-inositol dimannoside synthase
MSGAHGRTIVVTNDFPPRAGGIETYVDRLVGHLDPERVVVHACGQDDEDAWDAALPYPVVRDPASTLLPGPGLAARVRRTARRFGATSAWFPSAAPLALLAPALRAEGVRTVVASAHGHEVWWARTPGTRSALRAIGDRVDVFTVDSAAVRRPISAALRADVAARTVLLSPGVDADRFDLDRLHGDRPDGDAAEPAQAAGWDGNGDGPVVLCVSRAVPRKGHARLLDVWPELRRRHPSARLVLAGDGPELDRLRSAAAHLDGVEVLGRVPHDDLPALYARADVFVLPVVERLRGLITESLGIVLLEAAAAGLPVVSGRAGGTVEAVLHERTGLLVDAADPAQLVGAVDRVLADPQLAADWGRAGRSWVRRAWSWERTGERLRLLLAGEPVPRW